MPRQPRTEIQQSDGQPNSPLAPPANPSFSKLVSSAAGFLSTIGRVTRSRSASNASGIATPMADSVTSSTSVSSVPTPTQYISENDNENDSKSTPATSAVTTPNSGASSVLFPATVPAKASNHTLPKGRLPGFQPASSLLRLEIELPSLAPPLPSSAAEAAAPASALAPAPDSMKALSKSKYALDSKRKRNVFDISDDDDEEVQFLSIARDADFARQLQEDEDKRHTSLLPSSTSSAFMHAGQPSALPRRTRRSTQGATSSFLMPTASGSSSRAKREASESKFSAGLLPTPSNIGENSIVISSGSDAPTRRQGNKRRKTVAPLASVVPAVHPSADSSKSKTKTEPKGKQEDSSDDDLSDLSDMDSDISMLRDYGSSDESNDSSSVVLLGDNPAPALDMNELGRRRLYREYHSRKRAIGDRSRLEDQHPVLRTMWENLEAMPVVKAGKAPQPKSISRQLKPFQLEGLAWMTAMEKTKWRGGLLGDEMGLGKTIQAVSLIMSDYPVSKPTLVLVPPVALMQWTSEIAAYTDGRLKTFVFHSTNNRTKGMTVKDVRQYDVILMSYNSLESMFRKQERGFKRADGVYREKSVIHQTHFHRIILDEAHCIKTRSTMTAKACFALKVDYRWCLTGTPLQNRIGEFFSLLRFLEMEPFANYICRDCKCCRMEWNMDEENRCKDCKHQSMRHVSVFNQELLNPIQRYGNMGPGQEAFRKLRKLTDHVMLRRLKRDHTDSMELPVKEVIVDRQFFSEVETDFANSIMTNSQRKFTTYVANGVMLNNYANIFGLIMQMRQVADHPDLILRKSSEGSQNVMVCCICDEVAEEAIQSRCRHDFCRECAKSYLGATAQPDCPRCHIPLSIDLEQPEMEQDQTVVKKTSIINRIRMDNWTSSSKIELLVHNLYRLRSDKASHKSIIFSQFTTMLQLIEWRLRRAGITTVMLDGSMTPAQRQASIEYFKNNVDVECFLVSLKAGGVALNLVEASRVFIVDPWWNPAAEWQSADRCHRIGQTRPCIVTRLCIEDSVESRMVMLQEKKTRMINSTINSDNAAMESLTPEDLQFLFRGT